MPQLIPFTFVNTMITLLVLLGITLWVLSQVILPILPRTQLSRVFIINL